jgi:predicted nuclease of predicted toxin-antitoxin system
VTVALYMDEHVHRAITTSLRLRGVDVLTAQDDGRRHVPDQVLLDRATELRRILFSQDEDLLVEANLRQRERIPFAGVVYAHQLQVSIGVCVRELELLAKIAVRKLAVQAAGLSKSPADFFGSAPTVLSGALKGKSK